MQSRMNPYALSLVLIIALTTLSQAQIVINELDADTAGTDTLEFIELYDGGIGNYPLAGLTIVFFNGSSAGDASYLSIDLSAHVTDVNGFFVIGNVAVVPAPSIVVPSNSIQNGADAVAIYQDPAAMWPNGSTPTAVNLIDALVYDTNDSDDPALIAILTPGQPQINEGGGSGSSLDSIGRCPNGGTPLITTAYTTLPPTPGTPNPCGMAPYPGTQEDLVLRTGINAPASGGQGNFIKTTTAGDSLQIQLESVASTFVGRPYLIVAELFGTGTPPAGVLPVLHVSLGGYFVLVDGATPIGPFLQPQLPIFGTSDTYLVPAGFPSTSLLIQGLALDPTAGNGFFATTNGYEVQIL